LINPYKIGYNNVMYLSWCIFYWKRLVNVPYLIVYCIYIYIFDLNSLVVFLYILDNDSWFKKSLNIPKGDNQNPYIEEEQTTDNKCNIQ
jgi:hypothetical protein